MIINRIYEHQNSVAVASFLPGRAKDLSAPLYWGADKFLARPTSQCYFVWWWEYFVWC